MVSTIHLFYDGIWNGGIDMRFLGLVGRAVTGVRIRRVVRPHLVFQEMYQCFLR